MSKRRSQDHITGRYREDMPPPVERDAPEVRVRRPGCLLLGGLLVGILGAAAAAALALFLVLRPQAPAAHNAVWMGITWGQSEHEDESVRQLAQLLRAQGIDTLYVWTTWLQADATWSETTFENMPAPGIQTRFRIKLAHLDAWIGLPVDVPAYRLDDAEIRSEVASFATRALVDFGFDGVHINAEPVWDADENFLALLREVRLAMGEEATVSVAVPPDWNTGDPAIPAGPYTTADAHWSQEYKQRVAFLSDEMAVMAYNSGLSVPQDYQAWMAYQVTRFLSALVPLDVETRLIIGIPTYDAELPGHDPAAESIPAAVSGVLDGLAQNESVADRVRGLGIYAYWSTDASEWNTYHQFWLERDAG
jgi:hypothetical protein